MSDPIPNSTPPADPNAAPAAPPPEYRGEYSAVKNALDARRDFAAKNPGQASTVANEIAALEKQENDLAIKAGLRSPPPKFEPQTFEAAPRCGWDRPELSADPGDEHSDSIVQNYRRQGRNDIADQLERDFAKQREVSQEKKHANWHRGKAIEEERARCLERLQQQPHYFGPNPDYGIQKHLEAFAKTVPIPPYKPLSWIEKAPAGSIDPRLVKTSDVRDMSPRLRERYQLAISGQEMMSAVGPVKNGLGPFKMLPRHEVGQPMGASQISPIEPGSRVPLSSVRAEHIRGMGSANIRAFQRACAIAEGKISRNSPPVEGATITFLLPGETGGPINPNGVA